MPFKKDEPELPKKCVEVVVPLTSKSLFISLAPLTNKVLLPELVVVPITTLVLVELGYKLVLFKVHSAIAVIVAN